MADLDLAGIITRVCADLKLRFASISHQHTIYDLPTGSTSTTVALGNHTHSGYASSSHSHGSISSTGTIGSDTTVASGDKLVITDASNNNQVKRSGIAFGTSTSTFLRNDGTWAETLEGDSAFPVVADNITIGTVPAETQYGRIGSFQDSQGTTAGYLHIQYTSNDEVIMAMAAKREISGSDTYSTLKLSIDSEGTKGFEVDGNATLGGTLDVSYEAVLRDDVNVGGDLIAVGDIAAGGDLNVTGNATVGGILDVKEASPEIRFTTPATSSYPEGTTEYYSYIRAYDTNSAGAGHNTVIQTGGNLFLGGGGSPAALYDLVVNGATDVPALDSESPVIGTDSWMYFFSNCDTIANRQRMVFGGADGILEIPGNLRLVNKTETPTLYPNARARTARGYVYGDHITLRTREYDLDNDASSVSAQVTNVPVEVLDKDGSTFARLTARQLTDGTVRGMLEVAGNHTGSAVWNAICIDVRKDGSQHYNVNNAANFRSDLGINNAANLTTGTLPSDRLPTVPIAKGGTGATTAATARTNLGITYANLGNVPIANIPTITVAKGGTGATTAAAARSNLGAAAATWTQVATTTGTTAKTFTALNEAGYHEVLIRAYHSTDYWGTCLLRVADLTTSDREFYMTGGNISASSGRRACCKMQVGKITPVNIWIDGTNYSGTWHVFAR